MNFSKKKAKKNDYIEFFFEENKDDLTIVHSIIIPKGYDGIMKVIYHSFVVQSNNQISLYLGVPPEWFFEFFEKTKKTYLEKNKVRAIFYQKKEVKEILKEILLFDNNGEAEDTYDRFLYNGIIWTKDSGIYGDLRDALESEGYELDTKYEDGLFKIDLLDE